MGAAVALGDVVGEAEDLLVIAVVPLERDLDADLVALAGDRDRIGDERGLGAVEIADEGADPAFIIKLDALLVLVPRVGQDQADARIEEGELAEAVLQRLEVELRDLERVGRGQESDLRALLAGRRRADDPERRLRIAVAEAHPVLLAVAPDGELQHFGERVHHRDADAVQAAGDLVGILVGGVVELPAGMELGHDDLGGGDAFLLVNPGRDAAAIVLDRDRAVRVQGDQNPVAMAGQSLVDRIVRDLEHHVVEARAVVRVADIHARPLADRVEALQHLDGIGAVGVFIGGVCHGEDIGNRRAKPKEKRGDSVGRKALSAGPGPGFGRVRTPRRGASAR